MADFIPAAFRNHPDDRLEMIVQAMAALTALFGTSDEDLLSRADVRSGFYHFASVVSESLTEFRTDFHEQLKSNSQLIGERDQARRDADRERARQAPDLSEPACNVAHAPLREGAAS